jgi:Ca2+-binding RTX toxin-like protein
MSTSISYMTEAQLKNGLNAGHLSSNVQNEVIAQLQSDKLFQNAHSTVLVEKSTSNTDSLIPGAQVFLGGASGYTFNNTGVDPELKAIVADSGNGAATLNVTGPNNLLIGLGNANFTVHLGGSGNDTVWAGTGKDVIIDGGSGNSVLYSGSKASGGDSLVAGSGNDSLYGGAGPDTMVGGTGNDLLTAGSGSHQLLVGGDDTTGVQTLVDIHGGHDTLEAGTGGGNHNIIGFGSDTLYGGTGDDTLTGGNTSHLQSGSLGGGYNLLISGSMHSGGESLVGGAGNDTLRAAAGHDTLIAGSGDQALYDGSGSDSMKGGSGNDTFYVTGTTEKDTITGGTGSDTIDFLDHKSADVASYKLIGAPGSNDYQIKFTDGQVITDNGVTNLTFTDTTVKLP